MPARLAPMLAESGRWRRSRARAGRGSRSSTATACSPSSTSAACGCGRGAASSSRAVSGARRGACAARRWTHGPRRRDRRARCERQAVLRRAAGPRAAQDATREIAAADADAARACFCASTSCTSPAWTCARAPYRDRRRYLAQCLLPSPHLQLVHVEPTTARTARGGARERASRAWSAKRQDERATRPAGAPPAWLKVKATQTGDFVIGGYTRGKGSRGALGALLVGILGRAASLRYASHVGSGFDDRDARRRSQKRLEPSRAKPCPFARRRS